MKVKISAPKAKKSAPAAKKEPARAVPHASVSDAPAPKVVRGGGGRAKKGKPSTPVWVISYVRIFTYLCSLKFPLLPFILQGPFLHL